MSTLSCQNSRATIIITAMLNPALLSRVVLTVALSSIFYQTQPLTQTRELSKKQSGHKAGKSGPGSSIREDELRNVDDEDAELDYLYSVHEVGLSDYVLTKGRHFVLKKYLLTLPNNIIDIPELYVVTRSELKNFFRNPPNPERLRNGARLEQHWIYRGKMTHSHVFYIFERQ